MEKKIPERRNTGRGSHLINKLLVILSLTVALGIFTYSYYSQSNKVPVGSKNITAEAAGGNLELSGPLTGGYSYEAGIIKPRKTVKTPGVSNPVSKSTSIGTVRKFHIGGKTTLEGKVLDYYEAPAKTAVRSRVTVIEAENRKYNKIRVEETYEVDENLREKVLSTTAMVADHVIVKASGLSNGQLEKLVDDYGFKVRRKMYSDGMYLVETPEALASSVPNALAALSKEHDIKLSDPDYIVYSIATPNDSDFSNLWGLNNTGQTGGTSDADIDAPQAWNIFKGSRSVLVGIVDTGINYNHPDLSANVWTNPDEIPGNGLDDDGNGLVDDIHGYDFANDDGDPNDDNAHGSHCAGTIGGVGNNGAGVAGVNWRVSMMGLKFLDSSGSGAISDAVDCVNYATDKGVHLTSNSWGGGGFSDAMKDALENANAKDILFVAAAGNSNSNNDVFPVYPANYEVDNVISVAATDHNDQLAGFSSYGANTVDLGAPGVSVYSTVLGSGYDSYSGTSMATPHVAGVCALLKGYNLGLSAKDIKFLVLNSGDFTPALADKTLTGKRLNAFNALNMVSESIIKLIKPYDGKDYIRGMVLNAVWDSYNVTGNVKVELLKGGVLIETLSSNTANDGSFSWTIPQGIELGTYVLKVSSLNDPALSDSSSILISTERFPDSLDNWKQSSGSHASWSVASDTASHGQKSLKSDPIGDSQEAAIEVSGTFPAGVISFDKKVSSEYGWDNLNFYIDGVRRGQWSGERDWSTETYTISAGYHTFKWEYEKDNSYYEGEDCAWIDEVKFPVSNSAPEIVQQATATPASIALEDYTQLSVSATDPDGDSLSYRWSKLSGPGTVSFTRRARAVTKASFSEPGTYEIIVTVSDSELEVTSSVSVTVNSTEIVSERGSFNVRQSSRSTWHPVELTKNYQNPVVIFSPLTYNGSQPAHIRVKNVSSSSFEWQIEEWDYLDGRHVAEKVDYIVLEAGTYHLPDGRFFTAGNVVAQDSYTSHMFSTAFQSAPVVVTQLVSAQDSTPGTVRLHNIKNGSFDLKIQSEEANGKVHGDEIVSFIAVETGSYSDAGLLEADATGISINENWFNIQFNGSYEQTPSFFASFQTANGRDTADLRIKGLDSTQVDAKVQEETSKDSETTHVKEKLGYILFNLN